MQLGSFIFDILAGVLGVYLALTSALASGIDTLLGNTSHATTVQNSETEATLSQLPSRYEFGGAIPDVLIKHAGYQQAAVGAADADTLPADNRPITDQIEDALVNINCQYETDTYRRTTTGTGYFISDKGIILTNAHVAQYLLLRDVEGIERAECSVRVGEPAVATYQADLLYLPPTWINDHARVFVTESATGTGERDYALLYVNNSIDGHPMPGKFPHLPIHTDLLSHSLKDATVYVGGYPAGSMKNDGEDAALLPTIATTTIYDLYTFGSSHADIFSVRNSPVGEHGASGGPIVTESGETIGLITTKGSANIEGERSLRALTLSYVNRTILEETGFTLIETMRGDPAVRGANYRDALVPFLARILGFHVE